MVHDDLLEQIRQPLWDRVDRRLVAVLAVSIGAHLALAIAAWLGDPPASRPWLETESVAVYTAEEIPDLMPVALPPVPVDLAQPGIATPVAPRQAPAHVDHSRLRSRIDTAPPINPSALISDLVGDGPTFRDAVRHRVGKDLEAQIADAKARERDARVGTDGVEAPMRIGDGTAPVIGDPDAPTRTVKRAEVPPPRLEPGEPPPNITYDPTEEVQHRWMTALQRCYREHLELDPTLAGRVDLEFTLGPSGRVTSAHATGLAGVSTCVERLARKWFFPVELPESVDFSMVMIFRPS